MIMRVLDKGIDWTPDGPTRLSRSIRTGLLFGLYMALLGFVIGLPFGLLVDGPHLVSILQTASGVATVGAGFGVARGVLECDVRARSLGTAAGIR